MHAITLPSYGRPEVMAWAAVDDPRPGPGEVLIDVTAAGVNRADVSQRQGNYPPPPGAPAYPGLECSGRIAELGAGVSAFSVGDEGCALLSGGGYAERVAVPTGQLLPVPAGVDLVTAAGLPEVFCTVFSNVYTRAQLQAGESLLVHGGSSGIGTAAIQLAKATGARVLCTAGSPDKLDRCRSLGADVAINYRTEDFVERVREATGGRGADVILDIVGAAYLQRNVEALATGGRSVTIGLQGGAKGELNLAVLLSKRASVHATSLRSRPDAEKAAIVADVGREVWPLIESGVVRPVVQATFPMPAAAEAHRLLESSTHVGKVLLTT